MNPWDVLGTLDYACSNQIMAICPTGCLKEFLHLKNIP
jgi:hypothetical protein